MNIVASHDESRGLEIVGTKVTYEISGCVIWTK